MDKNDKKVVIDPDDLQDFDKPEPVIDESGEDNTDWKTEALKFEGMARRFQTKLKNIKELEDAEAKAEAEKKAEPEAEPQPQDKKEFDLAEESYLMAKGIKEAQFPLVLEELKSSKIPLKDLLNSPYFKEKLEIAASAEATPTGTPASVLGGDSVDYWIQKGQYPPNTPENQELRRKVATALAKQADSGSRFSPNPIV